jgi:hypothetical protein
MARLEEIRVGALVAEVVRQQRVQIVLIEWIGQWAPLSQ